MIKKIKKKTLHTIPNFTDHKEEAKFWEIHPIADFLNELKPVKARFAKNLSEGLHIRLDSETITKLRKEAKQKGIGPTTLVRMWILDQLQKSHKQIQGSG